VSRTWYPIVDDQKCIGCLSCVAFCPHGVYEAYDGKPAIILPENCSEFCHGRQLHAYPSRVISYFRDMFKTVAKSESPGESALTCCSMPDCHCSE